MTNLTKKLFVLASAVVGIVSSSQATAIISPPSLNPGDAYRIIFVTSTGRDATSTNILDYNAFVTTAANSDADLLSLSTTWSALASTSAVNALLNSGLSALDTTTPFFNTRGVKIATGVATPVTGLYGGSGTTHLAFIFDEHSFPVVDHRVWTGTNEDGSTGAALGTSPPTTWGDRTSLTSGWTHNADTNDPTILRSLYGISGPLTVPDAPVPEPGSIALTGMGAAALFLFRRFRQARN